MHAKDAINQQATHSQSMRAFMAVLREAGELISISQSVRLDYEVAGCLAQIDGGAALHFANVAGASGRAPMPRIGSSRLAPSRLLSVVQPTARSNSPAAPARRSSVVVFRGRGSPILTRSPKSGG